MTAGPTYEPIATSTVSGSSTTTISFTGIPSSYTDLILVTDMKTTNNNNGNGWITFNNDTGTNYSQTRVYGGASNAKGSDRQTGTTYINLNVGGYNNGILTQTAIFSYANTNVFKACTVRVNNPAQYVDMTSAQWRSTSAITRIDITVHEGYINAGSIVTLYGIAAA